MLATYRGDYYHKIEFTNGEISNDEKGPIKKNDKKHGTIVSCIVNQQYLGKGAHLPIEEVKDWIDMQSYQIHDNVLVTVEEWAGLKLEKTTKYKKKDFSQFINKFISDPKTLLLHPISLSASRKVEEEYIKTIIDQKTNKVKQKKEKKKKNVNLGFAFTYDAASTENDYVSFCNFTKTDDGGVHLETVEDTLCKFLMNKTKDSMGEAQKQKMDITRNDIKGGLKLVVNLSTDMQVQFMGNQKTKIRNEELKPVIREMVNEELTKFFEKEPGKLQTAVKVIKENARARIEAQKAKSATVSKNANIFSDFAIPNLIRCNNTGKAYKELFLVEGRKSAAGALVNGRDPNTQAIFGFRGVTANPLKRDLAGIMDNDEWRCYVKTLRTGIGSNFDINRLYYNKIIISTDADIDGANISCGVSVFHAALMPEIIEQGFLYKVYPPLYKIDNTDQPFIKNKAALTELYLKKVVKTYKVRVIAHRGTDYLNKDGLWTFLYKTIDYSQILTDLYDFYKVDRGLIEIIALGLVRYGAISTVANASGERVIKEDVLKKSEFIRDFSKEMQKKYPEMKFENGVVKGVANGAMKSIHINQRFVSKISDLVPIYEEYDFLLGVKEKGGEERIFTIGEFLDVTSKLVDKILARFKGLGEADAEDLWETTLNPAKRTLVRLTFDDIKRDLEVFNKLKSDKAVYAKQRKEMIEAYKIKRDDLDT